VFCGVGVCFGGGVVDSPSWVGCGVFSGWFSDRATRPPGKRRHPRQPRAHRALPLTPPPPDHFPKDQGERVVHTKAGRGKP